MVVQVEDLEKLAEPEVPYVSPKPTLLQKYQIPVQHLDFDYVKKCENGRELEKIYQILKSGEEGFYPELLKATETRLAEIKPNSKLLRTATPVLYKSQIEKDEWSSLTSDLKGWVDDITNMNQELLDKKLKCDLEIEADIRKQKKSSGKIELESTTKRISSTDYASWDKYDPDAEILKMDIEDENVKKEALKENENEKKIKKTRSVRFNSFVTEAEATFEANREKECGNECYKANEFKSALHHYTNSLQCKPQAPVYTNRALIYIKFKKYENAIQDCKQALKLQCKNFKAYFRMAQSYDGLNKPQEALNYVQKAIEIDPNNTAAQQLAERVSKECGDTTRKTRFVIQDFESDHLNQDNDVKSVSKEIKPVKPILKNSKSIEKSITPEFSKKSNYVIKPKQEKSQKNYELIPIPGTSKMPPPYYKIIYSNHPEVIRREKRRILSKPTLLHITNIDLDSDDEPYISHDEIRTKCLPTIYDNKMEQSKQIKEQQNRQSINKVKVGLKPEVKTVVKKGNQILTDASGGGEPHNNQSVLNLPSAQELRSSYTFMETWNSIRKDTTYRQHAQLLRRIDFSRLHTVIGYKLDDNLLTGIFNCLHRHFMVPGEINTVYVALTSMVQIPRFKTVLMFLNKSDKQCIHQLIAFLDQHDHRLPDDVKKCYFN